jgi:hypothetical protein
MAGVVLSSYVLILLGLLAAAAGYVAHRRGRSYDRYLVGAGGALVLAGVAGLAYFVGAFG